MEYMDATDQYMSQHSRGPTCPSCGKEMFPEDDHGRFSCFCGGGTLDIVNKTILHPKPIPQVDTSGMSDEIKAKIPPINRLHSRPTAAESKALSMLALGPACMDDPEYWESWEAVEKERNEKA